MHTLHGQIIVCYNCLIRKVPYLYCPSASIQSNICTLRFRYNNSNVSHISHGCKVTLVEFFITFSRILRRPPLRAPQSSSCAGLQSAPDRDTYLQPTQAQCQTFTELHPRFPIHLNLILLR